MRKRPYQCWLCFELPPSASFISCSWEAASSARCLWWFGRVGVQAYFPFSENIYNFTSYNPHHHLKVLNVYSISLFFSSSLFLLFINCAFYFLYLMPSITKYEWAFILFLLLTVWIVVWVCSTLLMTYLPFLTLKS